MVNIKEFSALLQITVTADRLSGSKIQALRDQAIVLADKGEDVELITKFFKLNSSLPAAFTSRISSLYVFDAIARDAKTASLGKEVGKGKGKATNQVAAAGLLMKMEGVVESWVSGMVEDGKGGLWVEGRDKMQKILDIWIKSSTFPQSTLDRLQAKVKQSSAPSSSILQPQILDPPPPVMSPALPPLDDVPGRTGSNSKDAKSTTPPISPPPTSANAGLPSEILKLLGVAQAPPDLAAPKPTLASGGIDLASILAGVKASTNSPNPSVASIAAAPPPTVPNFSFDPNQLKALANIAAKVNTPPTQQFTPPQSHHAPLPPHGYPSPSGAYPPPPVGGYQGGPPPRGYGNDQRSPSFDRDRPTYGRPDDRRRDFSPPRGGTDRSGPAAGWNDRPRNDGPGPEMGGYHGRNGSRDGPPAPRRRSRSPQGQGYNNGRWDDRPPVDGRRGSREEFDQHGPPGGWRDDRERDFDRGSSDRGRGRGRGRGGWDSRPSERERPQDGGYGDRAPRPAPDYGNRGNQLSPNKPPHSLPPFPPSNAPHPPGAATGRGRAPLPSMPGKDEFGRDLPAGEQGADGEEDMALDHSDDGSNGAASGRPASTSTRGQQAPPGGFPPFQPTQPPQSALVPQLQNGGGMESFDFSSFNPADPSAWAALARAWQTSFGREPNQMELMAFLSGQMGA